MLFDPFVLEIRYLNGSIVSFTIRLQFNNLERAIVMASKTTPTQGVTYINQFPKYFLTPYGQVKPLNPEDLEKKLSESNCEYYKRPNVALSQTSYTILSNLDFTHHPWFNDEIRPKLFKRYTNITGFINYPFVSGNITQNYVRYLIPILNL